MNSFFERNALIIVAFAITGLVVYSRLNYPDFLSSLDGPPSYTNCR
jgi:hypothetical protein